MHGILRDKGTERSTALEAAVSRIIIRYSDGRVMNFVPDAGRSTFHEDDILELQKLVEHAAATVEWADINTRLGF